MARIPVSGSNNTALQAPATSTQLGISGLAPATDGYIFYLTHLDITNTHATALSTVDIYDQAAAAATAANERMTVMVPAQTTVSIDIPEPGYRFVTNFSLALTNGTIGAFRVSANGYLA